MKLVLDTNVFISAFYWGGNPQKIIEGIIEGKDKLYTSNEILGEVAAVMARPKFKSSTETIKKYIQTLEKIGKKIFIPGNIRGICRDKDDDDKIECGILSGADYIITGDDDLLTLKQYKHLEIVTIREYLQIINSFDTSLKSL
jgi:putative PIN family toxin of toxin-antitoxin system